MCVHEFARDAEQCSFVGKDGRRCQAKAFLEIDHIQARALGGSGETQNLRLLCRNHNRLSAEQTFGREHIERRVHLRQRKYAVTRAGADRAGAPAPPSHPKREADHKRAEDLLRGLTKLGFRPKETRAALEALQNGRGPVPWHAPLDQVLRAATQMLTR